MLAHRLGLVPLAVHPTALELKTAEEAPSEKNTLVSGVMERGPGGMQMMACMALTKTAREYPLLGIWPMIGAKPCLDIRGAQLADAAAIPS